MKTNVKVLAVGFSAAILAAGLLVVAAVIVSAGPSSLVADPILVKASSSQVGLFEVKLNQDAGETLSSIAVTVNATASSTVSSADIASVSVYKDNGDGSFDPASDLLAGSQTTVNIGSPTVITTATNNTLDGGKFFVSLATSASWSDAAPADAITVSFPADGIVTSANSPTVTAVTTATITADTTAPTLSGVVAKNTGSTSAKEAGDSIELTFSEATNKPAINSSNIGSFFSLTNGHSFLDGAGFLGTVSWDTPGKIFTITLSASSSLPTVDVGDTITVTSTSTIADLAGNKAGGNKVITGSFSGTEGESDEGVGNCANSLINGRLYKIGSDPTVYLAAACRLKPFRGASVFHARGLKFQNIIVLASLPSNVVVSQKPVLPMSGTLVKGSDRTIWFVTHSQHRRGFRTAEKFLGLGFKWGQVKNISDADLSLIPEDLPIGENENHPDGALTKCGNSATVFQVIGNEKFPFQSADAFLNRGHSWEQITTVDCGRFAYILGAPVE